MADGAMTTETMMIRGHGGDEVDAYVARPLGDGPFPGVVVIQHIFGVDEWIKEVCRRFAHHGYAAISPNLYSRIGSLGTGAPQELGARLRAKGGLNDDVVMGDLESAANVVRAFPEVNGRVGTIGFCMGGRFAFLAACRVRGLDAAVDCWGGGVAPDPSQPAQGTAPIDLTESMTIPLLGIFGNDDARPDPAEVDRTEARLKALNKSYEFHRYDGAGHGFFVWNEPVYRTEQAIDGWSKVWEFFAKHLEAAVPAGSKDST